MAIPVVGAFVIIGVMDMVAIGLGLVTSGVVLQNAFDRYKIELTEDVADYWTTVLTSMSLYMLKNTDKTRKKSGKIGRIEKQRIFWNKPL